MDTRAPRREPVWKSTSASGAPTILHQVISRRRRGRAGSVERRGTGIATPSSRRRVDGVEDDGGAALPLHATEAPRPQPAWVRAASEPEELQTEFSFAPAPEAD